MNTLTVKRVSYGKDSTPVNDREYCIAYGGAVGCQNEVIEFAKERGYEEVEFIEKDGTKRYERIMK
jgi:hypothetical protein